MGTIRDINGRKGRGSRGEVADEKGKREVGERKAISPGGALDVAIERVYKIQNNRVTDHSSETFRNEIGSLVATHCRVTLDPVKINIKSVARKVHSLPQSTNKSRIS